MIKILEQIERIKILVNYLNDATHAYNNGTPYITDATWDSLYYELQQLEEETGFIMPNSPTQSITYEFVENRLEKVEHNHKMLSLDKTKDWNTFLKYFGDNSVIGMVKLDGLTCSLEYDNGELIKAETRGNGIIGENILHNAKVIPTIPKKISYKEKLILDGEIICTYQDFESFSNEYANPRNFASGSIRLLDAQECAKRKLTFVAWNVIKGFDKENSFYKKLNCLQNLGFEVVPWVSSFDWDAKDFLVNEAKKLGYPIDGLVGRFDNLYYGEFLGETAHHTKAAYAFKFYDEEVTSDLITVEWTMGRTGILTPVAVFTPVEMEGSIVERASLHNISIMYDLYPNDWYVGLQVTIIKQNQIIPQITKVEKTNSTTDKKIFIPNACPVCGGLTKISETNSSKFLICTNLDCDGKFINQLDHFVGKKGLDIKGLSKATLEKLITWGWVNNFSDIFRLLRFRDEWIKKDGFGPKSVDNILSAIDAARIVTLDKFICALGIPLIGSTVAKELVKHVNSYEDFRDKALNHFDFSVYEGFAEAKTSAIWNYNFKEADILASSLNIVKEEAEKIDNNSLSGITVVVTGKLNNYKNRTELQTAIEQHGGKVATSVSKNTNYLINNDNTSTSAKNLTAQKLGVAIITETEFIEKFFS